ncbi:response regulator [Thermoproteota archaeon]
MAKSKVLVIDDDVDVVQHILRKLKKHGIEADGAYSGKEALTNLKKEKPDLIVLDLLMPEMDGYAVSEKLRSNNDTKNIPIIILTAKPTQEDKVKALQMGIDDYITKPYFTEELVARINAVLRRTRSTERAKPKAKAKAKEAVSSEDKKRIDFVKFLKNNKIKNIVPEYNMGSQNGYEYPIAADFFKTQNGGELEDLNFLAARKALKKIFKDKILLCPFCFHHNINIRETSPTNHSSNISLQETIHHYRCGYNGLESEFLQGIRYICPKCHKELKLIGVDYDKPGKIYVDNESGEKFTEPEVSCQCRNCQKLFNVDDAVRQDVFVFEKGDRLDTILEQGSLQELNLEEEVMEQDINVYNLRYFRTKLDEELTRAKEFKRPLSLLLISIDNFDEIAKQKGDVAAKRILSDMTQILKENLWSLDIPARYEKNSFISLLLETDKKRVNEIAENIKERLAPLTVEGLNVSIKVSSFPEDGKNESLLSEKLIKSSVV